MGSWGPATGWGRRVTFGEISKESEEERVLGGGRYHGPVHQRVDHPGMEGTQAALERTLKTIAEVGGTTEKGQKMITKAEVFPMYKACKDSKDQGGFHDFVEILKLYDKNDDNTMLSHELFRLLTNLGEKLTKEEAKSLMKELCDPADDEGFMPFIPFLERMCAAEK